MGYDSASTSQDGRDKGSEHVFVRLFWLYAIISGARIGSRIEMFYDSMSDGFEMIDDEEEYEESGKGNRFLGFMFGNVDNSGDLDVDYLDEGLSEGDKIAVNGNAAVSGKRAGTLSSSRHRNHRAYLSSCGELAMTL
ncbi:hypothetical protein LR48_Vigan06g073200 [Vigna angularis]|uniref:TAFII-230 TBP-binding domain-containing protein n=1 Tax=Phaseolus angularis TaxID=3914 RepID=A0A0L9URT0_PHAAN|nr:hypothetical protein LR48_Vigan06g073200 [Vigna angularis]